MSTARPRPEIILALHQKKEELGRSNQGMVDGVLDAGRWTNKSMADRIFKQGAENESFRMDSLQPYVDTYLVDPEPAVPKTIDDAMEMRVQNAALQAVASSQSELLGMKDTMIRALSARVKRQDRIIAILAILLAVCLLVIISALVIDKTNPNIGFFWLDRVSAMITGKSMSATII